jgi:alanine racemase
MASKAQCPPQKPRGPPEPEAGGILTINLNALVANWRELKRRVAPAACAAVIKADGYGCGIEPVTAALVEAGCQTFFVADCAEARRVRLTAKNARIYVLDGVPRGTLPAYADADLCPVIGSLPELEEWDAFVAANPGRGPAALHIDTGMNRLGLTPGEAVQVASAGRQETTIGLIMSHFACADEPGHPHNARQMTLFRELRARFPNVKGSLANSSGVFLGPDAHHDLVRPGAALYGVNPTPRHVNLMLPVVRLEGRIIQIREIAAQATVGYGAAWTARRRSRIAVVAIGYADGLLRAAGATDSKPGAEAILGGRRCPVVGRISMDLTALDVTDLPIEAAHRGDLVRFLDEEISVDELASHAGTIGYEVLTSLGRRYRRVYSFASSPQPIGPSAPRRPRRAVRS